MPLGLDQKVGALVWSPLAGGRLSGKIGRDRPAPAGTRAAALPSSGPEIPQEQFFTVIETLAAIAAETERSVAAVALNWVTQRPTVASVIIGARNEAQLRENLGAVDFKLTADQMKRLDDASARPYPYPYWHQRLTYTERNPAPVSVTKK